LKIENKEYLNYSDVLIKPKYSNVNSRSEANPYKQFKGEFSKISMTTTPIMIANMEHTGTIEMAMAVQDRGIVVALHKFYGLNDLVKAYENGLDGYHFVSIGESELDLLKYRLLYNRDLRPNLMVDVANGYRKDFVFNFLAKVRKEFPDVIIAAGNVCTSDALVGYASVGIDLVKIGIGPGGQCRTRETAGVGVPQFTAVMDCVEFADQLGIGIIADGGINEYADFVKAIGAGADFVMAGSIFGGHDEGNPVVEVVDGKQVCKIYGMSSKEAQKKHYGELKSYRASEGRVSLVPYKGKVDDTITEVLGSLRSAMTYTDAKTIQEFQEKVTFIKVKDTINRKYEKSTIGI
jgi:GMP reductase